MRMMRLIGSVGPVPSLAGIRAAQLRPILAGDKKARGGRVLWVLPRRLGKVEWGIDLPWTLVSRTFAELPASPRRPKPDAQARLHDSANWKAAEIARHAA